MTEADRLYTRQFFQVLFAATLIMTGVSMQFHFGEYVSSRGFGVRQLGQFVGIGMIGSLMLRLHIGSWIDRLGCRRCFVTSAILGASANVSFQFLENYYAIAAARIVMQSSAATFLATVAVYAAQVAPAERRAESLGTIGIGGFLGMMAGPTIGDLILQNESLAATRFSWFFSIIGGFTLVAGLLVANLSMRRDRESDAESVFSVLGRFWPGWVLLPAIVFAAALTVHMNFLERYVETRSFENLRWFFVIYAPSAITIRVLFRQLPQQFGRRRICTFGLMLMAAGLLLFIPVQAEWQLIFPAVVMGSGHSLVFPSMVDLAAERMPMRYRGLGTSMALGAMDIGFLSGGFIWGELIDRHGFEAMFIIACCTVVLAAIIFTISGRYAAQTLPE